MTPSGRILSRYTADIGAIDLQLAFEGDNFCQIITMTLSLAGMIIAQVPLMTPVVVVAALVFTLSTVATDRANREVRRMANNSAAPVISRAHEMRAGGTLIRAMRLEPFFARRSAEAIDEWSRFLYLSLKGDTALGQSHHQLHLRHDRAERRALPDGHARRRASLDARKPPTF